MREFLALIRKEFLQLRRDPNMLRITLLAPIIQLLLLGYAVNTDVKKIGTDIYDYDQSQDSRELVRSFDAGDYFIPVQRTPNPAGQPLWSLEERFKEGDAEVAVIIPEDFSEKVTEGKNVTIGLLADGTDANAARSGLGYAGQIVRRFSERVTGKTLPLDVRYKFLYNPELESVYYMVPGIVATLLTMITVMLTSMGIVREKEAGTLEQLAVTPISGRVLLLGKIVTFGLLGMFEMGVALNFGVIWFKIPFAGSTLLLIGLSALYLLTTLGMGTFFATVTSTQQQAMFLSWFFSVFAILTSGFFTPISNMPHWMQDVTLINPMRYFMAIVRGIMMKGAGIKDLLPEIGAITAYGLIIFSLAAMRFRKRTA
jgi:ABC-2 type transport system permease protein